MRDQRGLTIVEVSVALLLFAIGIGAIITAFSVPQRETLVAQRQAQAAALAEAEVEQVGTRPFADIALTSTAITHAADSDTRNPSNPDFYVTSASPSALLVENDPHNAPTPASAGVVTGTPAAGEQWVAASSHGVVHTQHFAASGSKPAYTVYRYVTWHDDTCQLNLSSTLGTQLNSMLNVVLGGILGLLGSTLSSTLGQNVDILCSSTQDEKRVTAAVVLDATAPGVAPFKPVYVSTLVPDPNAGILY